MQQNKQIAKIFMNGRSQAVRLPKAFRISGQEVLISKKGRNIILSPKSTAFSDLWKTFCETAPTIKGDFMKHVDDLPPQEREWF